MLRRFFAKRALLRAAVALRQYQALPLHIWCPHHETKLRLRAADLAKVAYNA